MSEEQIALARRAVACKGWRWMAGMRVLSPSGWTDPSSERVPCYEPNGGYHYHPDSLPDLTDPATLGCLLALVREVWSDSTAHVEPHAFGGWRCAYGPRLSQVYLTEAEALVIAMEAAP